MLQGKSGWIQHSVLVCLPAQLNLYKTELVSLIHCSLKSEELSRPRPSPLFAKSPSRFGVKLLCCSRSPSLHRPPLLPLLPLVPHKRCLMLLTFLLLFISTVSWDKMLLQGTNNDEQIWLFRVSKAFESDSIIYQGRDGKGI